MKEINNIISTPITGIWLSANKFLIDKKLDDFIWKAIGTSESTEAFSIRTVMKEKFK